MGLTIATETSHGIPLSSAYAKITYARVLPEEVLIQVTIYHTQKDRNNNKSAIEQRSYVFDPDNIPKGFNLFDSLYAAIKSLPEFLDAVNT